MCRGRRGRRGGGERERVCTWPCTRDRFEFVRVSGRRAHLVHVFCRPHPARAPLVLFLLPSTHSANVFTEQGDKDYSLLAMQNFPTQLVTPRRTVYQRAQLREATPPYALTPRRVHRYGGSTANSSRYTTPVRATSKRATSVRDDVSEAGMSMQVDEEDLVERGLKFETLFAKSAELQVVFYAHLPAEVKLVLRNAGTSSVVCERTHVHQSV